MRAVASAYLGEGKAETHGNPSVPLWPWGQNLDQRNMVPRMEEGPGTTRPSALCVPKWHHILFLGSSSLCSPMFRRLRPQLSKSEDVQEEMEAQRNGNTPSPPAHLTIQWEIWKFILMPSGFRIYIFPCQTLSLRWGHIVGNLGQGTA